MPRAEPAERVACVEALAAASGDPSTGHRELPAEPGLASCWLLLRPEVEEVPVSIRWDELDDFARTAAEDVAATDTLVAPVFVAYDAAGPLGSLTVHDLPDTAEELIGTCVQLFAPLRPVRFAGVWQWLAEPTAATDHDLVSDDGLCHGLRIVRGEVDRAGASRWTSTVQAYRREGGRVVAWSNPTVSSDVNAATGRLAASPDAVAAGLRAVLEEVHHGTSSTAWLEVPGPPYEVRLRPDVHAALTLVSSTEHQHLDGRPIPGAVWS